MTEGSRCFLLTCTLKTAGLMDLIHSSLSPGLITELILF